MPWFSLLGRSLRRHFHCRFSCTRLVGICCYDGFKAGIGRCSSTSLLAEDSISRNDCNSSDFLGKSWSSSQVRQTFISYFTERSYTYFPSSSVVPFEEPSLFFINAGMNQFKPIFLGKVEPEDKRASLITAVNSQKCIRAGGKHNDLKDVGRDGTHQTFFEMLGNWSFRGRFSRSDACSQAWTLLTDVFRIPRDRLFVTFFDGQGLQGVPRDSESEQAWMSLGIDASKIIGCDSSENFWQMGETGPCGRCTEIHYSHSQNAWDSVELWNLVFIEFDRQKDGSLQPLPSFHVDTGMGLERLVSVLQGAESNYQTDLFLPILKAIHRAVGGREYEDVYHNQDEDQRNTAYRIVADHARMFTVAISDGVRPSSTQAGHILKRVIRNASYRGSLLTQSRCSETLLPELSRTVVDLLSPTYPELSHNLPTIMDIVNREEKKFLATVSKAKEKLAKSVKGKSDTFNPSDLFVFYNTHGLPVEVIVDMAAKHGIVLKEDDFNRALLLHREKSGKFGHHSL